MGHSKNKTIFSIKKSIRKKSKNIKYTFYLKISAKEDETLWAFLILGTIFTMVSRPILKNLFIFADKFYNI